MDGFPQVAYPVCCFYFHFSGWSAFSAVTPCIVCGAQQGKQLHARKCLLTGVDADNKCAESSFDWRDCNEQTTLGCTLMQGELTCNVNIANNIDTSKGTYSKRRTFRWCFIVGNFGADNFYRK